MRFAFVLACALACRSSEPAQQAEPAPAASSRIDVRVDRRIELFATLQRLVGEREYMTAPHTRYVAEVDAYFKPFANHPAVTATRELRRRSITYDAPMWLAVQLDDQLALRAPVDDPRFAGIDLEPYLASVRNFVAVSHFDDFFAQHRATYAQQTARLRELLEQEHPSLWFDAFFGKRAKAQFITVTCALCGTWSFGPHAGDEIYQIMGIAKVDFDELPVIDADTIASVVHEMAHSYVNPIFEAHRAVLEPHGQRLFARVRDAMTNQAYVQWDIMLSELGVRTVTALYVRDRRDAVASVRAIQDEVDRSFVWTPALVELIRTRYVANRAKFPSFEAFMPELVAWLATQ